MGRERVLRSMAMEGVWGWGTWGREETVLDGLLEAEKEEEDIEDIGA